MLMAQFIRLSFLYRFLLSTFTLTPQWLNPAKISAYFLWIVFFCAFLWFGLLGQRDLFDPDEGRYAGIPAAMVDTGDWLTPRLNDFKYFEKPVLQYWATAIAFKTHRTKAIPAPVYGPPCQVLQPPCLPCWLHFAYMVNEQQFTPS